MSRTNKEPKTMLRLASLLLALLIWVNFSGREDHLGNERSYYVPIAFENRVENTTLETENYQFTVTVTGSKEDLNKLRSEDVKLKVDLGSASPGVSNFAISAQNVLLPADLKSLEVDMIIPQSVTFKIIPTMEKEVSLFVFPTGRPAKNYEFIDLKVTPPKVTIVGPTAMVNDLDQLVPDPIDISGADKDLFGRVPIDYERQIGKDVVIKGNPEIKYTVFIAEKRSSRSFKRNYELDTAGLDGYVAKKTLFKLEISGPITRVDWFKPEWVVPTITLSEVQKTIEERNFDPNPGPENDNKPPAITGLPLQVLVSHRLVIPEEERSANPDWFSKTEQLEFIWTPEMVEVDIK